MNLCLNSFLKLLFDAGQHTCFAVNAYGHQVSPEPREQDIFFCINALHPTKDLQPLKDWHNEDTPRRSDANVVCYRNFLLEIDSMPLSEQILYVTSKLPVSAITFSGSKSYHFIISLEEPVSAEKYKELTARMHLLLPAVDSSTKNPSRLSRLPTKIRPDTGRQQKLAALRGRIKLSDLEAKLPPLPPKGPSLSGSERTAYVTRLIVELAANPDQFMQEHNIGGRNALFFYLGKRLQDSELPLPTRSKYVSLAYSNLKNTEGFSYNEALAASRVME